MRSSFPVTTPHTLSFRRRIEPFMGQFSKVEAQIPALMVESVFYGVYLITFFVCLQRLLWDSAIGWKPLRRRTNVSMLFIIFLLFASSSMSLSLTFVRNMNLFIYSPAPDEDIEIGQPAQASLNILKVSCGYPPM